MKPTTVTAEELRAALADLLLVASGFISGCPSSKKRALSAAIRRAASLLRAEIVRDRAPLSATDLIQSYIDQGGDWQELVAAMNGAAGAATIRRYQVIHETEAPEQTALRH